MAAFNGPETEQPGESMTLFLAKHGLGEYYEILRSEGYTLPNDLLSLTAEELKEVAAVVKMKHRDKMALCRLASIEPIPIPFTNAESEKLRAFEEFNNKVAEQQQLWTSLQEETKSSGEAMIARIDQELAAAILRWRNQANGYHRQIDKSVADIISLCQQNIERLKQVAIASAESDERCKQACRNATSFSDISTREAEIMSVTEELFARTPIPFLSNPAEFRITTLRFPQSEFELLVVFPGFQDRVLIPKWTLDFSMITTHLTFTQESCTATKSGATGHASSTVHGTQPLEDGVVHSWKIKILTSPVSGTHWYCFGVTQLREPTSTYNDATAISCNADVYSKNGVSSASTSALGRAWLVDDVLSFTLNLIDRTFQIRCERSGLEHVFTAMQPGVYFPFFHLYTQGNSFQLLEVNDISCLPAI